MTQHQELEQELTSKLERVETEQESLVDQLSTCQHQLSSLQMEKHDVEKSAMRLENENRVLLSTVDKVTGHCKLSRFVALFFSSATAN